MSPCQRTSRSGRPPHVTHVISPVHVLAFLFAAFFVFGPLVSLGQDAPDTPAEDLIIDEVFITADPVLSDRELDNPTKFMTVIDVRDSTSKTETVAEVLDRAAGVQINRYGGMGTYATISIRGSNPNQVQVYLDGVPMNRALSGVTNIEDLPLDNIAYIEVYRGFVPADFGQAGIGGAINLVTRKADEPGATLSGSYGSYETWKAAAIASGPTGPADVLVFFEHARGKGDYEYENDNGTPANGRDDFDEDRINNEFESYDLTVRAGGNALGFELSGTGNGHFKDQGLPGLQRAQARDTSLAVERGSITLDARNPGLLSGKLDLSFGVDALSENQRFDDPRGELGTGGERNNENRFSTAGARIKTVLSNEPRSLLLTGYVEYRQEDYQAFLHSPRHKDGEKQTRELLTYVVQGEWTDPGGLFSIQVSHRQENYKNDFEGEPYFSWSSALGGDNDEHFFSSPAAGVMFRLNENLLIKGNLGRYYRIPTFQEMFGDRGVALGNTGLRPEKGVNWDAGFVATAGGLGPIDSFYLEYAYFHSDVDDMIVFFQNSQRTVRATNIGGALIWGHEVTLGLDLAGGVNVSGNYTFQSAVDEGDVTYWKDNALPLRPMHEAYGKIEYEAVQGFKVWSDITYMSANYLDRANLIEADARHIYNAGLSYEFALWGAMNTLTIEGKNLSDDRVADVAGYPMPGTTWYFTAQAKW